MPKGHHGSVVKEKSLVMPRIRTGRKRRGRKLASTLKQKPMAVERKEPQTGEMAVGSSTERTHHGPGPA